jgi:hypothetical protein
MPEAVAAAAVGVGAAAGLALVGAESCAAGFALTAAAPAVALEVGTLEVGTLESEPHANCLPVTGKPSSVKPVSVATTFLG